MLAKTQYNISYTHRKVGYMYTLRVRLNGTFADITFHASGLNEAIRMCEAQYGAGSMLGVING